MNDVRVLHVDDEPDIREVVELALGLDPMFSVRACGSGREALGVAVAWPPDLILLDVMMPGMDGPTTLSKLRAHAPTAATPVVFMTARALQRELEHFVSLGAEGVIAKPFDPMTLAASVRAYVTAPGTASSARCRKFIERADADGGVLIAHRDEMDDDEPGGVGATAALEAIRSIAHRIAGSGGMFGLAAVSKAAAELEAAAAARLDGDDAEIDPPLDALIAAIAQARSANC